MKEALTIVWSNAYVRVAALALLVAAALWFVVLTRTVWVTLALAWLVAYLVQPLVGWCERRLHARWLGLVVSLAGFFLLIGLLSVLVGGLVDQAAQFSRELPSLVDRAARVTQGLPASIQRLPLPAAIVAAIDQAYRSLGDLLQRLADALVRGLGGLVTGGGLVGGLRVIATDAVRLFAFLALGAYLILDLPRVGRSLLRAVPVARQPLARELAAKFERSVGGYLRGQVVVAGIVGLLVWLGLTLLGVPLAAALGGVAAILGLVPFFGVAGIVPSLLLAVGLPWWRVLGVGSRRVRVPVARRASRRAPESMRDGPRRAKPPLGTAPRGSLRAHAATRTSREQRSDRGERCRRFPGRRAARCCGVVPARSHRMPPGGSARRRERHVVSLRGSDPSVRGGGRRRIDPDQVR